MPNVQFMLIKININPTHIWLSHTTSGYIPKRISQLVIEKPAYPFLWWHYSQEPNYRLSLGAHQWMNGQRKCGPYTQCSFIQLLRRMKSCNLLENRTWDHHVNWKKSVLKREVIAMFSFIGGIWSKTKQQNQGHKSKMGATREVEGKRKRKREKEGEKKQ
jgi:hypothetical protein